MFRDTTPTLIFELPFDVSMITDGIITLVQNGEVMHELGINAENGQGNELRYRLNRRVTSSLKPGTAEIQLWLQVGNESLYSEIFRVPVERILREWEATADEV